MAEEDGEGNNMKRRIVTYENRRVDFTKAIGRFVYLSVDGNLDIKTTDQKNFRNHIDE
jgi:hypothetical protein